MKSQMLLISKIRTNAQEWETLFTVSEQRALKKTSGWNPHKSLAPVASATPPLNRRHVRLLLCSVSSLREILNHPCLPSHLLLSVKYPPKITSPGPQINCHLQTLKVCAWFGCVIYDSLFVSSWCKPGRHSVQKQKPAVASELFATLSSIDPPRIDPSV